MEQWDKNRTAVVKINYTRISFSERERGERNRCFRFLNEIIGSYIFCNRKSRSKIIGFGRDVWRKEEYPSNFVTLNVIAGRVGRKDSVWNVWEDISWRAGAQGPRYIGSLFPRRAVKAFDIGLRVCKRCFLKDHRE